MQCVDNPFTPLKLSNPLRFSNSLHFAKNMLILQQKNGVYYYEQKGRKKFESN